MTLRERTHDVRDTQPGPSAPTGPLDLRATAERLLAQGADAIERALSQDSAAFLAANRQEGGQ
jgi:hypothetical protein